MDDKCLWEILIPCSWSDGVWIDIAVHEKWDKRCREISTGLTILRSVKGVWEDDSQEYVERMIPVRLVATRDDIMALVKFTKEFYKQAAIMCYKLSDDVILYRGTNDKNN